MARRVWLLWASPILGTLLLGAAIPQSVLACDASYYGCAFMSDSSGGGPERCPTCHWGDPVAIPIGSSAPQAHVTFEAEQNIIVASQPNPQLVVTVVPTSGYQVVAISMDSQNGPPNSNIAEFTVTGSVTDRSASALAIVRGGASYNSMPCAAQSGTPGSTPSSPFCVVSRLTGNQVTKTVRIILSPSSGGTATSHEVQVPFFALFSRADLAAPVPYDQYLAVNNVEFWDDPNGFIDASDVAYIDFDGTDSVTVNDLRLTGDSTSKVLLQDPDLTYVLHPGSLGEFCYFDDNSDLVINADETVYYSSACTAVAVNDVRIANAGSGTAAGSQVRASNTDMANPLTAFPAGAALRFFDSAGNGVFDTSDTMYWDSDGSGTVTINDVLLSGLGGVGHLINSGSPQFNSALAPQVLRDTYFDADSDQAYSNGDLVYLDNHESGTATVTDLRLSGTKFGSIVEPTDLDVYYVLRSGGPSMFCYVDDDGNGAFGVMEMVYYGSCSSVAANDIRVANPPVGAKGSQVYGTDTDLGLSLRAFPTGSGVGFVDADGDLHVSDGELVYFDSDASSAVSVGDFALSGPNAGTVATMGSPAVVAGDRLRSTVLVGRYFDANGDTAYGRGDMPYLDFDASGTGTVADVRMFNSNNGPFGSMVERTDLDSVYGLLQSTHAATCRLAGGGPIDTLYLQRLPCGSIAAGDIRIVRDGLFAMGKIMSASDAASTVPQAFRFCTIDVNTDGRYSKDDRIYLNLGATCDGLGAADMEFRPGGSSSPPTPTPTGTPTPGVTPTPMTPTPTVTPGTNTTDTPGPGLVFLALALGAVGLAMRRRK